MTGSAFNLGGTYATEVFTFGLFSLVGGSLADRLDRRRLMIACDVVRFAILAAFATAAWGKWLTVPWLFVGIAVHAACGAIFNGAQASSIPYVLGKDRATAAVATLEGTLQAANTVVPPLGGALFGLIGAVPALGINAATYIASQLSLLAVHDLGPDAPGKIPGVRQVADDILTGFRFLWSEQVMLLMAFGAFAGNFVGFVGYTVLVPFIERDLGGNGISVGFAFGSIGLGAVAGSLLAARYSSPFGRLVAFAWVIDGLAWVPLIWAHHTVVVDLCLGVGFMASAFALANVIGWRMRVIPEAMVGRVFGAVRLVALSGTLPGALLGGFLADHYGARFAIALSVVAYLSVACVLVSFRSLREERR